MAREVRTVVTEKKYSFMGKKTHAEKSLTLTSDLTDEIVKKVESDMGDECFYRLESITKAAYSMSVDAFVKSKNVKREVIE